jgi:hypothetical protein
VVAELIQNIIIGTLIPVLITFFVGSWYGNRSSKKKMLISFRISLEGEIRRINERRSNLITSNIEFINEIYLKGNLMHCSESFTNSFKWFCSQFDQLDQKFIKSGEYTGGLPGVEYYKSLTELYNAMIYAINAELAPFYRKWKIKFDQWKKFDQQRWNMVKISVIVGFGIAFLFIFLFLFVFYVVTTF